MNDNNIPNIPDGFIVANSPLPTNFNPKTMQAFQPDFSYLDKQVQENLKHVIPFEERVKPITDRQDKTIKTLEEQIDVYKVENQSLRLQLEQVNSHLREETARLKEETAKREEAESKLTLKDWKVTLIALGSALLVLAIEHYKDIYDFIISLIESLK